MKNSTAIVAGVLALGLVGGGAYALGTTTADQPVAESTATPTPEATEPVAPEATEPSAEASAEPTPEAIEGTAPEVTPEQQTCRDYVASKWQNERYPAERETGWTTSQGADGTTVITWTIIGKAVTEGPGDGKTHDSLFTCTLAADGSLVEVLVS